MIGYLLGLLVRLLVSALISACSFWVLVHPIASKWLGLNTCTIIYCFLGAPISLFNMLLPAVLQSGFAHQYESRIYCFPGQFSIELAHYVAIGLTPWVAILYLPWVVKWGMKKWHNKKGA